MWILVLPPINGMPVGKLINIIKGVSFLGEVGSCYLIEWASCSKSGISTGRVAHSLTHFLKRCVAS